VHVCLSAHALIQRLVPHHFMHFVTVVSRIHPPIECAAGGVCGQQLCSGTTWVPHFAQRACWHPWSHARNHDRHYHVSTSAQLCMMQSMEATLSCFCRAGLAGDFSTGSKGASGDAHLFAPTWPHPQAHTHLARPI
jgi:hypothetical protein